MPLSDRQMRGLYEFVGVVAGYEMLLEKRVLEFWSNLSAYVRGVWAAWVKSARLGGVDWAGHFAWENDSNCLVIDVGYWNG